MNRLGSFLRLSINSIIFAPKGLLCREPQKSDVRLSVTFVRTYVRPSGSILDHFWSPNFAKVLGNMDLGGPKSGHFRMSRSDVTLDVTLDHFWSQNDGNC